MTDREKLIALLIDGGRKCANTKCEDCQEEFGGGCLNSLVADHLIANGVVVREKGVIMNPVRKYRSYYSDDYCPVCGKQQKVAKRSMEKPWYCERCGQKLGWDGFNQFPEPPADMRKEETG